MAVQVIIVDQIIILSELIVILWFSFYDQSYGIHHVKELTIEYLTYVDYVELGGPADLAGMRKG